MNDETVVDVQTSHALTRRGMLTAGGAAILGAASGFALARATVTETEPRATAAAAPETVIESSPDPTPLTRQLAFYGDHQVGIETEPALHQAYVGLDLRKPSKRNAQAAMRLITDDAARLTSGQPTLGDAQPDLATNADLLTVTVGLGHSLLRSAGLGDREPPGFPTIPAFANDALEEPWSGTDLLLQVGANDPVALSHAIRMLTKDLSTLTTIKWIQKGFLASASADAGHIARRNLMGHPEGGHFPVPGTPQFSRIVWIDDGPDWARGGTVLVLRRMRMLFDTWDALEKDAQELAIGRRQSDGSPLGSDGPDGALDFNAVDANGLPLIPLDSHVRVAAAPSIEGVILRRPYNYDDLLPDGRQDRGLLFAAYTANSGKSFIPTQRRLTEQDAFQKWISAVGSATYFLPPGVQEGAYLASGLLT